MTAPKTIDINCDMGELPGAISDGTQESLMPWITSVNIACGGHAGDKETMRATVEQALRHGLAIGAHPGFPDKKNFGRLELQLPANEVADFISEQVVALADVAVEQGTSITHVKPHGALYNQAVHNTELAWAIASGVERWALKRDVVLVGLAGSRMIEVWKEAGFKVAAEAFADRRYQPDGTLRARKYRDALLDDPKDAAEQALNIASGGFVVTSDLSRIGINAQTLCIHGDTPGAPDIVAAVSTALRNAGISLRAPDRS